MTLDRIEKPESSSQPFSGDILVDSGESIFNSLVTTLARKHPETSRHSKEVALTALEFGNYMDLSQTVIWSLYTAAMLHDIGKVRIDLALLNKRGELSLDERDALKIHPVVSVEMVEPAGLNLDAMLAIKHHHEHYNGQGYPDGLVGEQIPLLARILSICDAFDAMVSQRAYKAIADEDSVLDKLAMGAGLQWDPELICRFIEFKSLA